MASTKIDIIANNKASAALGKVNRDVKKISTSSKGINDSFTRMKGLVLGVGAALGGIKLAKGFLDTATQLEGLGIQLKFITGSAEEGAKAFDIVTKSASKSAFSLEQMANASPLLLTVADNTDELNDLLAMTGDIAAATGLGFEETAGQIQRAMSGGIASADLFREKGVKSMLGFQEGVTYTAEESERMMKDAFKNATVSIAGAGEEMAGTFKGQMGMMNDAYFTFKKNVMEAGVFPALKEELGDLRTFLDDNKQAIDDMATALGKGLAEGIMLLGDAVAFVAKHSDLFVIAAQTIIGLKIASTILKIGAAFRGMAIAQALVLGMSGPAGWALIAGGIVAVGVAAKTLNAALGETEELLSKDEIQAKIKETKDRMEELAKANSKLEEDLKDVTPYTDLTISLDKLNEDGFGSLEDKIIQMPDLYDGMVQSMSANSAESAILAKELQLLEEQLANVKVETEEQIPALDEIVTKYKEQQKVVGLSTEMLSHNAKAAFSVHDEMSKNFIPTITTSTEMLSHNKKAIDKIIHATDIMTTTWATSTDMLSHNAIPTWKDAITIMGEYEDKISVNTDMLSHNAKSVHEMIHATDIMTTTWATSTDMLSHNYIPAHKSAVEIMGEIHDATMKQIEAEKEKKRVQEAALKASQKNYDKQFKAFENYQFAEMDLSKLTETQKVQFAKDGARTALGELSRHNKAAFALNKAFAIKDAIVNTATGVVKALSMGPIIGPIMAGIIGAMGAAQIATIASQQYTGRRFGGPVSNNDSYIVGENGPELFTPGATGRITANEGMVGKGQTINFNITATDAKSVDELIVQRKPMIVNMIRQATQERGNRPAF